MTLRYTATGHAGWMDLLDQLKAYDVQSSPTIVNMLVESCTVSALCTETV